MKEPDGDREREIELAIASEDEKNQSDDGGDSSSQPNAPPFLTELNLLVVLLSTLAPSDDESGDFEEKEKRSSISDHEAMVTAAKLRTKKREINEGKPIGRRKSHRLQTAPKDIRHGRRM